MTKDEYLEELKTKLSTLTASQISETIQYYSDYFDNANDDDKIIKELGNTDELAKLILNRYTEKNKDNQKDENNFSFCRSFEPEKIKNLSLILGSAHVVVIPGQKFSVEVRGLQKENFFSELSSDGTLIISNNKSVNLNFWNHEQNYRVIPRILISLPDNLLLNQLRIVFDIGDFEVKNAVFKCEKGSVELGAGNLNAGTIFGKFVDFRCGMGNLEAEGSLTGVSNIDCGAGRISLNLNGNENDYSYDAKVGLGQFVLNNHKKNGFGQDESEIRKNNHFSVRCGIGCVNIRIN